MKQAVLLFLVVSVALSSSTGIITGLVEDPGGDPLVGATVTIEGTPYGAMTSAQGEYVIPALDPGTYTVIARMVGRETSRVEGVTVQSDNTSRIDFQLSEDASGSTVIRVVDTRTHILRDVPATAFQLDLSEMRTMSSGGIVDVVATQPGVVQQDGELHVRGGRAGEVDYVLDGISLRSPMDNRFNFDLPMSAVSGATLMTGGLSIEYGNTLSGVVDLIGKEGGDRFQATIHGRTGATSTGMISSGEQVFMESIDVDQCRTGLMNGEFSLSGPEPLSELLLPSLGGDLPGEMTFSLAGQFSASGGDNTDTRGNWSYNWLNDGSGIAKLTYRPAPRTRISLSGVGSYRERGWNQWAWENYDELAFVEGSMLEPGSLDYALPAMFSETFGGIMNFSQLIGDKTALEFSFGHLLFQNRNRIYDQDGGFVGEGTNPIYWLTQYSPPALIEDSLGFFYNGLHRNVWHDSKAIVSTGMVSLDYSPNPRMRLKAGVSGSYMDLYQYNVYHLAPGTSYLSLWNAYPHSAAAYAQASYRFSGGVITTAGLRADYFDANTSVFSSEEGGASEVEPKTHLSPRLSFSVPFSERSLFFTTYGHYFQMPPMNSLFLQTSYSTGSSRIIAGNPALDPELTTLFEVGIRQELDRYTDAALSFYNKDITGLVSTDNHSEGQFYVFTNDDSHGNVRGLETSLTRMSGGHISGQAFYTLSIAKGRYSSMLSRYNYAQFGVVYPSREDNYLDWDQTHQAGLSVEISSFQSDGPELAGIHPFENASLSLSWKYGSGMPYTLPPAESQLVETNTERRPFSMQTDLSVSRGFDLAGSELKVMFGVFNLFNRRNIIHIYDTSLFHSSGDPTGEMGNPRAWSPARHYLLSAVFSW
ncbi:MAG TPA: TonB-dependent receptor [Candidatus Sabulitectum sp.]|nr:TonB-dependent receptor [Candidatus Sabulitectum sp.]HPF33286.1 TonB-dependent receptor [Candidatus Sabulitectum sp.]HPJ29384.1 TonB-dependent receptor [Candidatus Sabulitectum sp.]HPR23127.1 TonB-dependent receptor [Candidatus Sabulitectum sp.]